MPALIEARGLVKRFHDTTAVAGVDITVRPGERVALLGPNGAGKTTTLFMLLGVITPDAGTVTIAGHPLPKERSEAMMDIGFAAGYMPLADRMRVIEFLRMYARLYGIDDPDDLIMASLERFRIERLVRSMGTELSSGQRTLVGIVKATLHRPRLLVLDEPTASLDPDVAQRVRVGLMDYCSDAGAALLVTSHNMTEVERLCERVIFLAAGQIVADGSPIEVATRFSRDDLEGVFLHLASTGNAVTREQETDRP